MVSGSPLRGWNIAHFVPSNSVKTTSQTHTSSHALSMPIAPLNRTAYFVVENRTGVDTAPMLRLELKGKAKPGWLARLSSCITLGTDLVLRFP